MYYSHPERREAYRARDQYWFGTELVVAPFVKPAGRDGLSRRRVWLPEGEWTDFFSGERLQGGRWHGLRGGPERIPAFARAGAIVPLGPRPAWGGTQNPAELDVHVFPGADGSFDLYEDDGETCAYREGRHAITPLRLTRRGGSWLFRYGPVQGDPSLVPARRTVRVHLRGLGGQASPGLPGIFDPQARSFQLEPFTISPAECREIAFHCDE